MGSSQQFSLRWNNYLRHITSAFDSLRSDLDLVDVTLSCEGKKIKAHKMLLSACSTYFKDLFKENPCQHPVIIFRNVNFSDLEALVDFMYQGEVNVVQEQLASFLTTAELLAVQGLTDGNGQELAEGLDLQGESSEALGGAERSAEKKHPNNDSSSSFYSSNQNPMSPPAKRKKWNISSTPSSSQRASSDLTERRRTAQISSDGVTNPVDIIPVMSQVKVEIPEFLDSGQISFNNTGQEANPLSDLSVLDHNMPNTSRGGKEESGDVYGGSANDSGDIAGEQMTPAELSEVLSKAGPSSDGSQDSLQGMAFLLGGTSVRACASSAVQDRRLDQQHLQQQQQQHHHQQQQPEPVVIEEDPPELEEMVPLGNGVRCRKQYFDALMAESDSHSDWAAALLKGVFGKDACKMRARPRLPTNKKFPINFLDIAKFLHRKWLQKQCVYEGGVPVRKHSDAEVEKYVAGLPGYLSDRAEALMGPRGSRRGPGGPGSSSAASESGQVPVRVRRPRRPYKRRGSVTPVERPPSYNPTHPPPPPQEPQRPLNYAWHQGM